MGYVRFSVTALECLCTQQAWADAVQVIQDMGQHQNIAVNYLLGEVPICCRLPVADLFDVYAEIQRNDHVWEAKPCTLCRKTAPGAPGRRLPRRGGKSLGPTTQWRHVCIRCVCYNPRVVY